MFESFSLRFIKLATGLFGTKPFSQSFTLQIICTGLLVMFVFAMQAPMAFAQEKREPAEVEIPKEFKGFFDGYAQLVKKHPEVSKRFVIEDRKFTSTGASIPYPDVIFRSGGCGPSYCCGKYIDEGSGPRCIQCFFCPP